MGLIHPTDLEAWRSWQREQQSLRWARRIVRPRARPVDHRLFVRGEPRVLVALDATSTSMRAALVEPLASFGDDGFALLVEGAECPIDGPPDLRAIPVSGPDDIARAVPRVRAVLGTGHYLPIGALAHAAALTLGASVVIVQHGLLTPFAPPLPADATLLAWSDADARFWTAGRNDVRTEVVGSQLLWHAAANGTDATSDVPTYLGQLHGAELPRRVMASAARRFCVETGAVYRPHPAERDALSRLQHARWERSGIRIDRRPVPLSELGTPVVSVFSTGVLEAAASGRAAWVHLPDAPPWVRDLWQRYDLSPWGGSPTPAPPVPAVAPGQRIAEIVGAS